MDARDDLLQLMAEGGLKSGHGAREKADAILSAHEADILKADWVRYRGAVLNEVWTALRDAEGGPLRDAMNVVTALLEES